jgi:hypothetical protein
MTKTAADFLEEATLPDILENFSPADADDKPHERYVPRLVPDHGRQPRRPKRPALVVWNRDPQNLYKPADNSFLDEREIPPSASDLRKSDIARMLANTARDHAPRLRWRTDEAVTQFIEMEALPDARFVASSLAPDEIPKVLDRFVEVLWEQIDLQRNLHKSRRRDNPCKNLSQAESIT